MSSHVADVALRPATWEDSAFCLRVHEAAMGAYVAAVHGWVDAEQRAYHERVFRPGSWQVVTVGGADAGNLVVEEHPDRLYLARLELHPDHQGQGVGARVLRTVTEAAAAGGRALFLDVLTVNTRARAFYERHGFRDVARHGLGGFKVTMRHVGSPPAAPGPAR
ncbi:GNAT family N-acetyltransferase [Streptomyces nanshensis]|uniref:N-acetyltransferase domain-containing protein n=1 Tax=Streptomyces nanshensis TaxID=518642 RepID=A0A1E7KGK4_9ACTN|nr:GNAT family N-acetyltransferase [Streptomyces nanshensis]OEV03059.1 hypothetical protein AN218_32860 [Streptomyces nanshensis]